MEELKKQRKCLRSQTTKLLGKDKNTEDDIKLQVLKEQLLEKRKELKDVDKQILILTTGTDEEIEKEYETSEEYQEKIIEAIKRIDLNLNEREEKKEKLKEVLETSEKNETTKKTSFTARLPKLELPVFQGDINSWFSFWQVFDANIHQREDLSIIEKLTYLLSLLRGEPARMVSSFAATAENYADIVEILKRQYGHKDRIVDLNVKRILEMKPISNVAQLSELKSLITEISINLRNLKNLGIDTNNCSPILNTKIKQLIPADILLLYERQKKKEEETNIEDLIVFLQTEISYRESVTPLVESKAPPFKPRYMPSWRPPIRPAPTFRPRVGMQQYSMRPPPFVPRQPWMNRPQHPRESRPARNFPHPAEFSTTHR